MHLTVCSIYDAKAACYQPPFFTRNEGVAARWLAGQIGDPNSDFFKHAEDFSLMNIGTFDDENGEVYPNANGPKLIVNALQLKAQLQREAANVVNLDNKRAG